MEDLRKSKKIIFHSIIIILVLSFVAPIYAYWYEEPIVSKKEDDIDSMWWLSKRKKQELKEERQKLNEEEKKEGNRSNKFKWIYNSSDLTKYPKSKWEIIDDDNDLVGYNYYFDNDGYLLKDTITPDFRIVDKNGKEVDSDFRPIKYDITKTISIDETGIILDKADSYVVPTKEPAKVIIGEGVVLREKVKIFDNSIDKRLTLYVDKSNRYNNDTKVTIFKESIWKNCQSIKGTNGYVVYNNPSNNFNSISGKISCGYGTDDENPLTFSLLVYDADKYDDYDTNHHLYDIEELYTMTIKSGIEPLKFSFTFDRSIKRLRFEIIPPSEKTYESLYFKDLKFGFSKSAYKEELERKKNEEVEIEYLKSLGIYVEDFTSFEALDEDGNIIEEDDEETEHENENNDDEIGGTSYVSEEETYTYEDKMRDRTTGPAFDKSLENEHTWRDSGPAFVKGNTNSVSNVK